jgi:apolipoprotein D and lipocalin family protein
MRPVSLAARLAALGLLAACAAPAPPSAGYRDPAKGIYSNAVFQPERLAGRWVQVAEFAPGSAPACAASGMGITPQSPTRLAVQADLCLGGKPMRYNGEAEVTGPGRVTLLGADPAGLGAEWWVLWVDDGYRTLVVGTPSGQFGMILNRDAALPPDRLAAAREILDWNGYDLSRLRPVAAR